MKYIFFIISYTYSFYAYVNILPFCVDNYLTNIKYSEGIINPINPDITDKNFGNKYIYYFLLY